MCVLQSLRYASTGYTPLGLEAVRMSPQPVSSSEAQTRYLAGELDRWADQIEAELSGRVALPPSVQHAKRQELYDVHRQIKALRDRFPRAFS